jgi:hypothetical protein
MGMDANHYRKKESILVLNSCLKMLCICKSIKIAILSGSKCTSNNQNSFKITNIAG